MGTKTLDKYDFESVHEYLDSLEEHIFHESNKKIRLITIVIDGDNHQLCCQSSMPKHKMFSMLVLSIMKIIPERMRNKFGSESSTELIKQISNEIRANESLK